MLTHLLTRLQHRRAALVSSFNTGFLMTRFLVAGSGTDVGKTVACAILTQLLEGEYWKPVQCGDPSHSDTAQIQKLINFPVHPPAYSLRAPLSPHHAARLEGIPIRPEQIIPPITSKTLIIESVGGVLVPLTSDYLSIDLFKSWNCQWILVSKHYVGSINHTLLTLDLLKKYGIPLAGLIFNGLPNPDTESVILNQIKAPFLARLLPEPIINSQTIQRYTTIWKPLLAQLS